MWRCKLFGLKLVAIYEVNETLGNLEKVAIWFKRSKVGMEYKVAIRWDLCLLRLYIKRVFTFIASLFVNHRKQSPVYPNRERELVIQCNLSVVAECPMMSEPKVHEFVGEP